MSFCHHCLENISHAKLLIRAACKPHSQPTIFIRTRILYVCIQSCIRSVKLQFSVSASTDAAAFEPLLWSLQLVLTSTNQSLAAITAQMTSQLGASIASTASAAEQIANIEFILTQLVDSQLLLNTTVETSTQLREDLLQRSVSPAPYDSAAGAADLTPFLLEARTNAALMLANMAALAQRGYQRYVEIVRDVSLQIDNIRGTAAAAATGTVAGVALQLAAIREAQDELREALPDGTAWLMVVQTSATEAVSDVTLRLANIRRVLGGIASPSPPFSAFVGSFLN